MGKKSKKMSVPDPDVVNPEEDAEAAAEFDPFWEAKGHLAILSERSAARVTASYTWLTTQLVSDPSKYDMFVDSNRETLGAAFRRTWRKGGVAPRIAASKLAAVVFTYLGTDGAAALDDARPILLTFIADTTIPAAPRAEAARTLALAVFIVEEDPEATSEVMAYFVEQMGPAARPLRVALYEAWALLATTMSSRVLADSFYAPLMPKITSSLESEDLDLRLAAGTALAVLFSAVGEHSVVSPAKKEELIATLQTLTADTRRYRPKAERAYQKNLFRNVFATVTDGSEPTESLVLGRQTLSMHGWDSIVQLYAFRDALGTGLQAHMLRNDLLRDIFGVVVDTLRTKATNKADSKAVNHARTQAAHVRKQYRGKRRDNKAKRNELLSFDETPVGESSSLPLDHGTTITTTTAADDDAVENDTSDDDDAANSAAENTAAAEDSGAVDPSSDNAGPSSSSDSATATTTATATPISAEQ